MIKIEEKHKNNNYGIDFVKWFSELSNKDILIAGGKGASLSEMYNNKFPIPPGFIITAQAYKYFIEKTGLNQIIRKELQNLDVEDTKELERISKKIRKEIEREEFPKELEEAIEEAYDILDVDKQMMQKAQGHALDILRKSHEPPFVAVRSSATTEDLATASFAGQQESFLNVKGNRELIKKVRECFSSLFTARAIYYRIKNNFDPTSSLIAVVVQKMIDSEKSGVMFSRDPVSAKERVVIEAVWGLGEGIVSGSIKPDHYELSRDDSLKIEEISVVSKKIAFVRDASGRTIIAKLKGEKSNQQVLNENELKRLARYAIRLEEHYKKPQDIEFAIAEDEIYIVQSRPITTRFEERESEEIQGDVLLRGLGASPGRSYGKVVIVHNLEDLDRVKKGDVLVTEMTNPDMVVAMQRAAGIITNEGGITSHAAIVSREMGIPAVVGTNEATTKLKEGEIVTVDGSSGIVYQGKAEKKLVEINPIVPTKTKIKVIVDLPDYAQRAALSGSKSVGLTRLEGIIASSGKHPLYFVKKKNMEDYVKILTHGLSKIIEYFDEIWVRTSDIRSDEYKNLEGAPQEVEGNPMLGNHGIRFSIKHKEILTAEIESAKIVAEKFRNKHIGLMIPQVISVSEVQETKKIARELDVPKNVKIGIMIETPAAVQIIKDLCEEGIDFISFGTNDLTQYTLAIDRNNTEVQDLYDEMNPAVLNSISCVIRECKKYKVFTSICGQAGSRKEMVAFLLKEGIDSISVNADAAKSVSELVASIEKQTSNIQTEKILDHEITKIEEDRLRNEKKATKETSFAEEDIETLMLKQLDAEEDYSPSISERKEEIPKLNDSIPVMSEHFEEKQKDKVLDIF